MKPDISAVVAQRLPTFSAPIEGSGRVTRNPEVMGGKPCVRGKRVTVGAIVGLVASGHPDSEILTAYPYLEEEDIRQALAYAAWRVEEIEVPLPAA